MSSHIYWQIEAPQNVFGPVRVAESTPSRGEARLLASKNKWWRPPLMIAKNASIDECTVPHFVYGLIIVLVLSSLILASPLQARIQLDIVAKFRNVGIELDIVTLIDWEVEAAKSKVALLAIATPPRSSFSFRGEDWSLLIDLWSKAVKAQSESWNVIGTMKERETSDVSILTISAGPGIKIVIDSPRKGPVSYVLSKDDLARFAGTLYRGKEFLS